MQLCITLINLPTSMFPHPIGQLESALDTAVQQLYGVDGDLDRRSLSLSVSSSELPPSLQRPTATASESESAAVAAPSPWKRRGSLASVKITVRV